VPKAKRSTTIAGRKALAAARAVEDGPPPVVDCDARVAAEWELGSLAFYPATLTKIHLPRGRAAAVDLVFDDGGFWNRAPPEVIKRRPAELAARLAEHAAR